MSYYLTQLKAEQLLQEIAEFMTQYTRKFFRKTIKKTMKINEQVIIGFTGDRNQCDKLATMISSDIDTTSFVDDVISYIENFLSEIPRGIHIGIAICGIDKKEKMCSGVIYSDKEKNILYPVGKEVLFYELYPNRFPKDTDNIFKNMLSNSSNPIDAMKETINYYSKRSPSVNNKITFENIKLNQI